jgi:Fe2+ or Zn2+ uptake regulation protein
MYKYIYVYTNNDSVGKQVTPEQRNHVMNFIRNNQGCKAQDIVEGIKKDLSRAPIFDTLSELVEQGAVRDEKINRRDHRYFLNEDNLLVSIPAELDQFKDYFFKLIHEVNRRLDTKIKEHDKKYPEHLREDDPDDLEWKMLDPVKKRSRILYSLLGLYQHLVGMYILRSLSIWPKKIKNKEAINKLYTEVFNRFQEIQEKLTSDLAPNEVGLYDFAVENLFILKPFDLEVIVRNFYKIGVDEQIEPVMDSLWEISNKSIPFDLLGPSSRDLQLVIAGSKLRMAENGKLKDWGILMG